MREVGEVVAVTPQRAQVRMTRSEMCAKCGRCGTFAEGDKQEVIVEVLDPMGVEVGNRVEVELGSREMLTAAYLLYLVPLGLAMVGYLLGNWWANELMGVLGGALGLVISFYILRHYDRLLSRQSRFLPVIVRTVN